MGWNSISSQKGRLLGAGLCGLCMTSLFAVLLRRLVTHIGKGESCLAGSGYFQKKLGIASDSSGIQEELLGASRPADVSQPSVA
eukprot:1593411-Rhodomonas_salina.1